MDIIDVLGTGFGTAAGAWLSYRVWLRQRHRELVETYDTTARKLRIVAFQRLWKQLEPFALYAPAADVTLADVTKLADVLRHWYFGAGGLVMTEVTRDVYFLLQEVLQRVQGQEPVSQPMLGASRGIGVAGAPERRAEAVADETLPPTQVLRSRNERLGRDDAKALRKDWGLPDLDLEVLENPRTFKRWQSIVRDRVAHHCSDGKLLVATQKFLLVQCHVSWLRTALVLQLHSRDPSPLG